MLRLDPTLNTDGMAISHAKEFIDAKIRESRRLLASRKTMLKPEERKAQAKVIKAQKEFYESLFGFKW